MKTIHVSKKNNVYQHIEVIKNNRKKRSRDGEFFIEGAKSINNAVENNWSIKSLISSETEKLSEWGKKILKHGNVGEHIILTPELMRGLSDKDEDHSEILALVYIPDDDLNRIQIKKSEDSLLQVIGTTSQTELIIDDVDMVRPTVLMIGNETRGLSHNYKMMCDVMTRIPMYGKITSYNVACATSMMLYEINRQRRKHEKI